MTLPTKPSTAPIEENLKIIQESVRYLKQHKKEVVYDGSDDEVNEIEVGDGYGFKGEKIKVRATKPEIELKVSAEMGNPE